MTTHASDIGRWHAERAAELLHEGTDIPAAQTHALLALFWQGKPGSYPPSESSLIGGAA